MAADSNFTQTITPGNSDGGAQLNPKGSPAPLYLGIASLILILVPFVNFILATIGFALAMVQMRKKMGTDDGHVYMVYKKWASVPSNTRAAFIVCLIGIFTSIPSAIIGTVFLLFLASGASTV